MNCKPGDLAIVVDGAPKRNLGRIVRVTTTFPNYPSIWNYEGNLVASDGSKCPGVSDDCLKRLPGGDGNEDFVVKARKTLPRAKPVTGPVTINERGEVA